MKKTSFFIKKVILFRQYFNKIINVGVFNNMSYDSKLVKKFMAIDFEMFIFYFISSYFITQFTIMCHL